MCVRMALSCVFCVSDWEAKNAENATMQHYRAPQGDLKHVSEGRSSQERDSDTTIHDYHRRMSNGKRSSGDSASRRLSAESFERTRSSLGDMPQFERPPSPQIGSPLQEKLPPPVIEPKKPSRGGRAFLSVPDCLGRH